MHYAAPPINRTRHISKPSQGAPGSPPASLSFQRALLPGWHPELFGRVGGSGWTLWARRSDPRLPQRSAGHGRPRGSPGPPLLPLLVRGLEAGLEFLFQAHWGAGHTPGPLRPGAWRLQRDAMDLAPLGGLSMRRQLALCRHSVRSVLPPGLGAASPTSSMDSSTHRGRSQP